MSSESAPVGPASRGPLVIILAIIGILAIIAGIMYVSGAANSLHFMAGSSHHGHHIIRAIVSFVVGIAFLIGAYIAKTRPPAAQTGNATSSTSGNTSASGT